jgi:hypothetical protein
MTKSIRIITTISPNIESLLRNYQLSDEIGDLFGSAYKFFVNFKHIVILIIPIEIKAIFYSNAKLKIFLELVEKDTQTNIMFAPSRRIKGCKLSNLSKIFPQFGEAESTNRQIVNSLYSGTVPLLVDKEELKIEKKECSVCGIETNCAKPINLATIKIPNYEIIKEKFVEISEKNIQFWHLQRENMESNDLKALAFLVGIFHDFPEDKLSFVEKYFIHKELFDDLRRNISSDFVPVSFSMLRAAALPSSTDPNTNREPFSIDWHRNDPYKIRGRKLYRVDVLPATESGINNSGIERLLMAKYRGHIYFLAYSRSHDFSKETIENRISTMHEGCT